MADLNVEVILLRKQLKEEVEKVKFLEQKKSELKNNLKDCEEFTQRLVNYLIISANQQEKLEKELKDLKLLFLEMDIKKRKKDADFNRTLEQINERLQNLSI